MNIFVHKCCLIKHKGKKDVVVICSQWVEADRIDFLLKK